MQRINDFQSIIGRDLFQTIAVVQLSSNTRSINSSAKHSFFSNFRRYKVTKPLKAIIETVRRGPNYVNKKRFHYSRLINISLHTRSVDLLPVQPVGATRLASARGGARSKFRAPTFESKFFLKHMGIEESTCDIVGIFAPPRSHSVPPTVIWRPHSDSALGGFDFP